MSEGRCRLRDASTPHLKILTRYLCLQEYQHPDLNVGFSLDEGIAVPDDTIPVYYGERNAYINSIHKDLKARSCLYRSFLYVCYKSMSVFPEETKVVLGRVGQRSLIAHGPIFQKV